MGIEINYYLLTNTVGISAASYVNETMNNPAYLKLAFDFSIKERRWSALSAAIRRAS
jgi:hypothetical protein